MTCRIFRIRWQSGRCSEEWFWHSLMDGDEVSYQPRARSVSSRPKHLKQIGVDPDFRLQRYTPKKIPYKIWTPNPTRSIFGAIIFYGFQGMKPPVCVGATMLMICMHFHISLLWDFQHVFFQSHFCASLVYSFCTLTPVDYFRSNRPFQWNKPGGDWSGVDMITSPPEGDLSLSFPCLQPSADRSPRNRSQQLLLPGGRRLVFWWFGISR